MTHGNYIVNKSDNWRDRYYELESTLEQLVLGFEKVLRDVETTESPTGFEIYKITRVKFENEEALCCVANGANLEYKFEYFNGSKIVSTTPFSRINISKSPVKGSATHCKITVKSHAKGMTEELIKEAKL